MIRGGFGLIGNVLDVPMDLPTDLVAELRLERANDAQVTLIKTTFPRHYSLVDP